MAEEPLPADRMVDEIESLCMNCHADGNTRLLLTQIPFFREIVIMSFFCPHCGYKNSEIQSAGEIQQRGIKFTFRVEDAADLQRQIVKGDGCVFRIEEVDLEIPAGRGQLTNLEGLISMVKQDLEGGQEDRKKVDEAVATQVQVIIDKLGDMAAGKTLPFTVSLDDPSGNSSVEPSPNDKGHKYTRNEYPRTMAQNAALGLSGGKPERPADSNGQQAPDTNIRPEYNANQQMYPAMPNGDNAILNADALDSADIVENEVYSFPASCPGCTKSCVTNMKMVKIPHFDEVVLMSTVCEHCGYRSNEVKTGGSVPELGRKITLQVRTKEDLSRDILKAESCSLACPELNLTVEPGTLGGRFTTIEGLLTQVRDDLKSNIFDAGGSTSDSMQADDKSKWSAFFGKLDDAILGGVPFTCILEDPLAGSYVQSFTAPEPDPQIEVVDYKRTEEEEEYLGLSDLKTENYAEGEEDKEEDERAEDAAE